MLAVSSTRFHIGQRHRNNQGFQPVIGVSPSWFSTTDEPYRTRATTLPIASTNRHVVSCPPIGDPQTTRPENEKRDAKQRQQPRTCNGLQPSRERLIIGAAMAGTSCARPNTAYSSGKRSRTVLKACARIQKEKQKKRKGRRITRQSMSSPWPTFILQHQSRPDPWRAHRTGGYKPVTFLRAVTKRSLNAFARTQSI